MGAPYNPGRRVAGDDLLRLGLAQESVEDATVVGRTLELAAEMASYPAVLPRAAAGPAGSTSASCTCGPRLSNVAQST